MTQKLLFLQNLILLTATMYKNVNFKKGEFSLNKIY